MQIFVGIIIAIVFMYLNIRVIESDIKYKKIPNHYILKFLYLLPIWYIYAGYFGYFGEVHALLFIFQIILSLFIGFLLFHFGLWGAGDAKYLLLLALFIPHIGIIPFIGNIAFITIISLLFYFIWFLIGPNLWFSQKRSHIYKNIWKIKKDQITIENQHKTKLQILLSIGKALNVFFILFISLRLLRIHALEYLYGKYNISIQDIFMYDYVIYIVIAIFIGCILIIFIIRHLFLYIKSYLDFDNPFIGLVIINIIGILFLSYEYLQDPSIFLKNIILILSIYLGIYCIFKFLLFAYKLVFITQEESLINIHDLKEGMIIDKNYLFKRIHTQGGIVNNIKDLKGYFSEISTSIEKEDIQKIIYLHELIDRGHKDLKTPHYTPNKNIKIVQTFSYAIYIFFAFCLSGFLGINIFEILMRTCLSFFF